MRNLKRALSLALASTMLLGMMVVGTSAKTIDFTDSSEIANKDAVAVTSAIGIFDGYDNGSFQPTKTVTRAEMAVIVCKMLYGSDVNVAPYAETTVFTDVPAWAAGYVNMAAELGITSGVGDNKFNPNAAVTTAQAALMLSKALGYFNAADETAYAMGWELAAITRGTEIGLFGDMALTSKAGLSRDNVAEMTFNALENATVRYNAPNDMYYNGPSWINGMLPVSSTTSTAASAQHLLGKNFDELTIANGDRDEFNRPVTNYSIDGDVVATVANEPDAIYTTATKMSTIDKGRDDITTENLFVNSNIASALNKAFTGTTADSKTIDGMVVEVFEGEGKDADIYVAYNYYVGEVTRVGENSDDEREITIGGKKFATESFAKEDMVVYTVADGAIQSVETAKTVEGELTATTLSDYIKVDGVKYTKAANFNDVDDANLGDNVLVYVDANGIVIRMEVVEASDATLSYAYVEAVGDNLTANQIRMVFADGTEKTVEFKMVASGTSAATTKAAAGDVVSFTEDDGEYTLSPVDEKYSEAAIENGEYSYDDKKFVLTTDTIFVDNKAGVTYVGYEAVPDFTSVANGAKLVIDEGVVEIMFIVNDDSSDAAADSFFYVVDKDAYYTTKVDKKEVNVYTDAYVDGGKTEVVIAADLKLDVTPNTLYKVNTVNDNDVITSAVKQTIDVKNVNMTGSDIFFVDNTRYEVTDETVFVIFDGRDEDVSIYQGSIKDLIRTTGEKGDTTTADVVSKSGNEAGLVVVYLTTNA